LLPSPLSRKYALSSSHTSKNNRQNDRRRYREFASNGEDIQNLKEPLSNCFKMHEEEKLS